MHPVRGIFNLSECNDGGRKTLASRYRNHRVAVNEIKPKPHDHVAFLGKSDLIPQLNHNSEEKMTYHLPQSSKDILLKRGFVSLFFRRWQTQEIEHQKLLQKDPLNVPANKKYREKTISQLLQNYCQKADPYGYKESFSRRQKHKNQMSEKQLQEIQNDLLNFPLTDNQEQFEIFLLNLMRKYQIKSSRDFALCLNEVQQIHPEYEDDMLMQIYYKYLYMENEKFDLLEC